VATGAATAATAGLSDISGRAPTSHSTATATPEPAATTPRLPNVSCRSSRAPTGHPAATAAASRLSGASSRAATSAARATGDATTRATGACNARIAAQRCYQDEDDRDAEPRVEHMNHRSRDSAQGQGLSSGVGWHDRMR